MPLTAEEALKQMFRMFWKAVEDLRMNEARRMWDWYYNDREAIIEYVKAGLSKHFDKSTVDLMNIRVYNLVRRIVQKIALVYKLPSERLLDGGKRVEVKEGATETETIQTVDDIRYQELLAKSTVAKKAIEWHRLGRLFNTVLVQPRWLINAVTGEGYFDFTIHTPAYTVVNPMGENFLWPKEFYYPVWVEDLNGDQENVLVFWSTKEHYYIDAMGNKKAVGNNLGLTNPYGILPVVPLRFQEGTDFWGEGMWDVVDGNEEISIQFANLCDVAIFQSHGQPYGFNLGLKGKPRLGADSPITVDNLQEGMQRPEFGFAQASPMIEEVRNMIDWMAKWMQQIQGLGSANATDVAAELRSGISKLMDNAELAEIREEDRVTLEMFERNLFVVMREIYNYHNPGKKISDKAEFAIKFGSIEVKKSTDEQLKEWESGLKNGWLSQTDIIMERNPGMSREEAEKHLQRAVAEKRKFKDMFGLTELEEEVIPSRMADQLGNQKEDVV